MITSQLLVPCLALTLCGSQQSFGNLGSGAPITSGRRNHPFAAELAKYVHTRPFQILTLNQDTGIKSRKANTQPVSFAVQGGNSIGGTILDNSRRPVPDLHVELLDDVEKTIRRVRTDGVGRYEFTGLSIGTYYVRVQTYGTNLASQTARVTLVNVSLSPGRGRYHEELSFILKPADDERTKARTADPSTVFSQDVPESARKLYEEAVRTLEAGKDTDKAIEELNKAIKIFPAFYLALDRIGAEYVKQKQYEQSLNPLSKAIEVNPKGHTSLHTLGVAQYYLKRMDDSVESLRRAVSLAPTSVNSQFWLGIVLFRSGKMKEAEEPLKRAAGLGGNRIPDVHMFLAQIYSNSSRYKEAADELELFLKETPDAGDSHNIKALIIQLRAKAKK